MPLPVWLVTATPEQLRVHIWTWFAAQDVAEAFSYAEIWTGVVGRSYVDAEALWFGLTGSPRPPDPVRIALDALVEAGALRLGYHPRTNAPHWALVTTTAALKDQPVPEPEQR